MYNVPQILDSAINMLSCAMIVALICAAAFNFIVLVEMVIFSMASMAESILSHVFIIIVVIMVTYIFVVVIEFQVCALVCKPVFIVTDVPSVTFVGKAV